MRFMMALVFLLAGSLPSAASPGDHQKIMEFMKVHIESCAMGHNPNKRFGCFTWMK